MSTTNLTQTPSTIATPLVHRDTHQTYADGYFHTHCTCGWESTGYDPDDADSRAMDHVEDENEASEPGMCGHCEALIPAGMDHEGLCLQCRIRENALDRELAAAAREARA